VALIMAANPQLTPAEVESILEASADDLGSAGWDPYFGYGRVNAAAAVQLALGGSTADTFSPTVAITSPLTGAAVSGMVPVDVSASDNVGVQRVELLADGDLVGTDYTSPYAFSWDSAGAAAGTSVTLSAYAYDAAGNVGETSITVTTLAVDTLPPVVTAPPAVSREATGALTSVNLGTATAIDAVDGALAATANPTGPFAVGQHTVVWSATDSAGNTGSAQQQVTVRDTTAPTISPPADITVAATGTLTSVNLGQASAEDLVDGTVTARPDRSGPFAVGTTVVTWSAADRAGNTATATQRVTVTLLEDITAPVITAPPNRTVEATGPLTAVDPGVAVAVDDVDGTVTVSPSQTGPFAPGVHLITWTARDAAGNTATAGQTITVRDTTPPVITPPDDITVGATGYLTEVDLGGATGADSVSGAIQPVAKPQGPYLSGLHVITWTATDQAGNQAQATQRLTVLPLVSLAVDQTVSEGSSVTVTASLSGAAARYPVSLPYTVGGSATNPGDHDAVDGAITITTGTTGNLVFHTVDDGITGESADTVVFTLQAPDGAVPGAHRTHTVTIIEDNAAPLVDLRVEQRGASTLVVSPDNGFVQVTAMVHDPNPQDAHRFDWSLTDNNLVDTGEGGEAGFSFDPQWLADGIYAVHVSVTDNGIPEQSVTAGVLIRVSRPPVDEDLIDTDQDGIPDYLDGIADPAILPGVEGVTGRALLITEPGLGLRLGGAALAAGKYAAGITLQDIEAFAARAGGASAGLDNTLSYPGGFFDFAITGLPQAGQSARIVIPQAVPMGEGAVYRKYHLDRGWQDLVEDSHNQVASAPGSQDSCPEPGAQAYQPGLHAGHYCVQLTLEDGGANDADGQRNGVIEDPGGVGVAPQSVTDAGGAGGGSGGGGGGGGGCTVGSHSALDPLLALMVSLSVVGLVRRRCA
jgi:hypothetical protein